MKYNNTRWTRRSMPGQNYQTMLPKGRDNGVGIGRTVDGGVVDDNNPTPLACSKVEPQSTRNITDVEGDDNEQSV
jgi:hypothetical protein